VSGRFTSIRVRQIRQPVRLAVATAKAITKGRTMVQKAIKTAFLAGAAAATMGTPAAAEADDCEIRVCEEGWELCWDVVHCEENCTVTPNGTKCDPPTCHTDEVCIPVEVCWCEY
jgi:uncharacterized membrane protein